MLLVFGSLVSWPSVVISEVGGIVPASAAVFILVYKLSSSYLNFS